MWGFGKAFDSISFLNDDLVNLCSDYKASKNIDKYFTDELLEEAGSDLSFAVDEMFSGYDDCEELRASGMIDLIRKEQTIGLSIEGDGTQAGSSEYVNLNTGTEVTLGYLKVGEVYKINSIDLR